MAPIRLGKTIKNYDKKTPYTYAHVTANKEGWVDSEKFLPVEYDLCYLKVGKTVALGWWCGTHWDGRGINADTKIVAWRRRDKADFYT